MKADSLRTSYWREAEGVLVPKLSVEDVQCTIDKKNKIFRKYPESYIGDDWLLVVADGHSGASSVLWPDKIASHTFESCFTRTFVFEVVRREHVELNTKKQAT